jgi:phage head maturation protease
MAKRMISKMQGRALIQPATLNEESREVEVVFATETPVFRFGWEEDYNEVLICEESAMRVERANKGLPVLDTHNSWTLSAQLGRTVKVWVDKEKRECKATVRFSQREQVKDIFQDIKDGIVTDISVGYRVHAFEKTASDSKDMLPVYRAVDWEPTEISFVSLPADPNSGVRSENRDKNEVKIIYVTSHNLNKKMATRKVRTKKRMDYEVVDNPVKEGDEITIEEVVYVAQEDGELGDIIQVEPKEVESEVDDPAAESDEVEENRMAATKQERARLDAILISVRAAKLEDSYAIELYKSNKPIEQCRQEVLEKVVAKQVVIDGRHSASAGADAIEKKRAAIQEAILHRVYPSVFKLTGGKNEYRGMTLVEMGKELLTERGVNVRGLDKTGVANLVFARSHSSGDFPILFEGAIDKMLRTDYDFTPEFWDKIARQTSVTDFRAKNLYQVESLNGMTETSEGGEIKYTTLVEGKSSIRVKSYAEGIKFTRQAFINDDLNALSIIPSRFVKDWDELRGDLVWGLITANGAISDGKALFSIDHKNLLSGAPSALSEESLAVGQLLFKKQTALDGKRRIRVIPQLLIVPPELEVTARKLLTAITASTTKDVNVFTNAFTIIVEPRLTDPDAWYLSADPNAIDSLYYAYLEGNESLRVNNEDDFNTDSMKYAVRGDFGAVAVDYRGMVKSSGKA